VRSPTTRGSSAWRIEEREQILAVLDDPPQGLAELRAVLLAEHVDRKRDGFWRLARYVSVSARGDNRAVKEFKRGVGCVTGLFVGMLVGSFLFATVALIYPDTEDDFYGAAYGIPAAVLLLSVFAFGIGGGVVGARLTEGRTMGPGHHARRRPGEAQIRQATRGRSR
jgi:hypothetical protein